MKQYKLTNNMFLNAIILWFEYHAEYKERRRNMRKKNKKHLTKPASHI